MASKSPKTNVRSTLSCNNFTANPLAGNYSTTLISESLAVLRFNVSSHHKHPMKLHAIERYK